MRVLVCDDEPGFLELISEYCIRFKEETGIPLGIIKFDNGRDVLDYCHKDRNIDLFILDIKMDDVNGIRLAKELRKREMRSKIVFLTSVLSFATKGYEIGINRYWVKPLLYSRFCAEMKLLCEDIEKESHTYLLEHIEGSLEKVYFDDIAYIETAGRKTFVHRSRSSYLSTRKMIEYEKELDERFYRCHAAYIVNMDYIKKVKGTEVYLNNDDIVYISKGKKSDFSKRLAYYLTH